MKKIQTALYPNPSLGEINLLYRDDKFKPYSVSIYSGDGKEVFNAMVQEAEVKLYTDLPPGSYHLLCEGDNFRDYHSLIIH